MSNDIRKILVATVEPRHGSHSSYTALADYTANAEAIRVPRDRTPGNKWRLARTLSRVATSRWYQPASISVEKAAMRSWREDRAQLIHVLWGERDLGFLDIAARFCRIPLCVTLHGCPDDLPGVFRFPARLQNVGGFILMSEVQRPFLQSCGIPNDRIAVVHHGIDCRFFRPPAIPRSAETFTVLAVGDYRRNFRLLRKVCESLIPFASVRVRVLAHPSRAAMFSDLPNVEFLSGLSEEELVATYQQSSCLVMTVEATTANNALLEALACGLPVVAEDVGGLGEYAASNSATFCPANDVEVMVAAILELAREPRKRQAMSLAARRRAEELDWPTVQERTEAVYEELLSRFRQRA